MVLLVVVAMMPMPMMITRLCSGPFYLGLGRKGVGPLPRCVLPIQGMVLRRSAIWRTSAIDLGRWRLRTAAL